MDIFLYIVLAVFALIAVLYGIYFLLLMKVKKINKKIYKYKMEEVTREKNILIVYQPSRHQTTYKISKIIKEYVSLSGYGYKLETLSNKNNNYQKYEYIFFVAPVYFSSIHQVFLNKLATNKIKNLIVIYNGVNKESEKEDLQVKSISKSIYEKTKLHTDDIEQIKVFLERIIKQ